MKELKKKTYSKDELFSFKRKFHYSGEYTSEIGFPLGGIGSGCISLGGWGQLRDWEIMNRPAKGFAPDHSFFTLKIHTGKKPIVKVLQGPVQLKNLTGNGHSAPYMNGEGLPHFQKSEFTGPYPIATVKFFDPEIPLEISLQSFNPFIPLNDKDSSLPVAILLYNLQNPTRKKISGTLYGNIGNIIGHPDKPEGRRNQYKRTDSLSGLWLTSNQYPENSPKFGTMALTSSWENLQVWPRWGGSWWGVMMKFWDTIQNSERLPEQENPGDSYVGTVGADFTLQPGERITIPFFISWHFPNFEHWKKPDAPASGDCNCGCQPVVWKNYYASQWKDAWEVAEYTAQGLKHLYFETFQFQTSLVSCSYPDYVIEAVANNLSILKSPTCLRLPDGTFYGFEGCHNTSGCCEGSCTHVWNYAQALPYLFPNLQRSMRKADYKYNLWEDGGMTFRIPLPLGTKGTPTFHPAADGQMGGILQVYREWQISGNNEWLKRLWPGVQKSMEYAWKYWDADKDGVMEGVQHNTYDIEFYGPNAMMGTLYLGALRAASLMAEYLGEKAKAREYQKIYEKGRKKLDATLFQKEYYFQEVNPDASKNYPENLRKMTEKWGSDEKFAWPKWQYGKGCLADQVIGEWYGRMLHLGPFLKEKNIQKTLASIFKYNWKSDLTGHPNTLRIYALGQEPGLLLCSWPKGERPGYPFPYADEVWCGIEYQVAAHLIYEGMMEEGLSITRGVRLRHNGKNRNPWDEFECGHHYARSLASYSLLLALSGFYYSGPQKEIGFHPRMKEKDFYTFFSVGSGWGSYAQTISGKKMTFLINLLKGNLDLKNIRIHPLGLKIKKAKVLLGKEEIPTSIQKTTEGYTLHFSSPISITQHGFLKALLE